MTTAMTRLTAGSSHSQPVARTAKATTTTPAETSASAAMCRKAPLILRSDLRPDMKSSAVAPLIAMPTSATQMTVISATGSGLPSRCTASHTMAPTATSSSAALASDTRIELRLRP